MEDEQKLLERRALDGLARAASPALRRLACRYVGRPDAEDAVQDAYVRLLSTGEEVRHPRRFLVVATTTLALDRIRRLKVRAGVGPPEPEAAADRGPGPEELAGRAQALRRLSASLSELPQRSREALLLSRVEGLTHLAISRSLGVSPKTVERDIVSALRHCATRLAEPSARCA
ncbi:MAG: sigma-70 family RNA polymerase sigma factor [Anaeromyxobacter sp.]|nr:sigma-70 family RNA polymerase sigma factor [Anaeromyxobacter sp.]MBL0274880.1 sigma-70 family RNA polymerase sigma factor [Anaeromyxobacter sp.]